MTGDEGLDIGPRHAAPRERAAPGEREDVFALGRLSQNGYGCGIEKEAEVEVAVAEAYELSFVAWSPKRKALDIGVYISL